MTQEQKTPKAAKIGSFTSITSPKLNNSFNKLKINTKNISQKQKRSAGLMSPSDKTCPWNLKSPTPVKSFQQIQKEEEMFGIRQVPLLKTGKSGLSISKSPYSYQFL